MPKNMTEEQLRRELTARGVTDEAKVSSVISRARERGVLIDLKSKMPTPPTAEPMQDNRGSVERYTDESFPMYSQAVENLAGNVYGQYRSDNPLKQMGEGALNIAMVPLGALSDAGTSLRKFATGGKSEEWLDRVGDVPVVGPYARLGLDVASDIGSYVGAPLIAKQLGRFAPQAREAAQAQSAIQGYGKGLPKEVLKMPAKTSLDKAIETGVSKGIKPTVLGKQTIGRVEDFYNSARNAVKTIAENKDNLEIFDEAGELVDYPKTAGQFAQAIDQTKKSLYRQYHDMAIRAGDEGAKFNSLEILEKLDKVASSKKFTPEVRAYAESMKEQIAELDGEMPDIIEARISDLNSSLKGLYEGRIDKAKAQVDASIASAMREELDKKITESVGEGYQGLKNQYGMLKNIEQAVNKRAVVNMRQSPKGLTDLTDVFTGGEIASGIVSMNPALVIKGLAGKGIKEYIKEINRPDRYIEKMFKEAWGNKSKQSGILGNQRGSVGNNVMPKTNLTNEDLSELAQYSDNMGYNLSPKEKREIFNPLISKLKKKGISHIDAYHITNGDIEKIKKDGLNGSKLNYVGGTDGNLRESSVYLFLDQDDIKKGGELLNTSEKGSPVVHIKIPVDYIDRLNWDSNFNMSTGTHTAERFKGDIPKEWIKGVYEQNNITTEGASAPKIMAATGATALGGLTGAEILKRKFEQAKQKKKDGQKDLEFSVPDSTKWYINEKDARAAGFGKGDRVKIKGVGIVELD